MCQPFRMVTARQANIAVEQMQAVGLGNVWSSGGKLFRVVNSIFVCLKMGYTLQTCHFVGTRLIIQWIYMDSWVIHFQTNPYVYAYNYIYNIYIHIITYIYNIILYKVIKHYG